MIIHGTDYNGVCACGHTHIMTTELSVIESGCLRNIKKYMEESGISGFSAAVYDENTYQATMDRHPDVDCEIVLNPENLHANEHGIELLMEKLPENADVLIAIGSGTVHDLTRYCASVKNAEFISCPTAASVDGFCSSVAALTLQGCKKTVPAIAPKLVVADIDIIKEAPLYLAKSGFGDMVGKYIALADWKIANILTGEYYCSRIVQMTRQAVEEVVCSVTKILNRDEEAFIRLTYGLILSGLAMQMTGTSRPASGAEHHISHMIEMAPEGPGISSETLHGEKVGVGTLLAAQEYQSILCAKNIAFRDYIPEKQQKIKELFGNVIAEEMIKENEKDTAVSITGQALQEHWSEICDVLKEIKDADELKKLYEKAGIKSSLSDIGIDEGKKDLLLAYSYLVRNRLTLMRMRKCLVLKKGIIFDMDGTLWDSSEIVAKSWTDAIKSYDNTGKVITPEDMKRVMGLPMDKLAAVLFSEYETGEQKKLLDICCHLENEYILKQGGILYPKLEETWEALKEGGYHLYIVSNCQSGYIEAFLEHYGFASYFDDFECFGNTGLNKAENIKKVIQRNHLEEAVYVGDTQGDYEAARSAGSAFIHASYGFGRISGKTEKIKCFEELKAFQNLTEIE